MSRYRFRPWMALALTLALLVVAFFSTFFLYGGTNGFASAPENIAGSAAAPVVQGTHGFTASITDFFKRLFALRDVDKKYKDLETQVQKLQIENQFMQDLQQENEQLNTLLGAEEQEYPTYKCLPASVIGRDTGSNWFIDFTLDRGSADGVAVDMPVVNEDGLVGRVVEVGRRWCKVMAIIDPQSAVPAIIEHSRDFGMVCGSGDPNVSEPTCSIDYLAMNANVVPGDRVVTSELGGIFYNGVVVGTVGSVSRDKSNNITANLIPAVDFSHIENVLIITSNKKIPTASDIAKEEAQMASASPSASPTPPPSGQPSASPDAKPTQTAEDVPG